MLSLEYFYVVVMVEDLGVMEKPPKFEGRYFNMYVTPQK